MSKVGKEKTGVRTNVSHASQAFATPHVCSDGGDGNGGMPANSCVIGRCGYEDKYRSEPSFVITTVMWKRAWQGGAGCCASRQCKNERKGAQGGRVHAD